MGSRKPSVYLGILRGQALAQLISFAQMGRRLIVVLRGQTGKGQPWGRNSVSSPPQTEGEEKSLLLAGESPGGSWGPEEGGGLVRGPGGSCPTLPWGCSDPCHMPLELMLGSTKSEKAGLGGGAIWIYPKGSVLTWGDQEH